MKAYWIALYTSINDQDSLKMQEKLSELISDENLRQQLSNEAIIK